MHIRNDKEEVPLSGAFFIIIFPNGIFFKLHSDFYNSIRTNIERNIFQYSKF